MKNIFKALAKFQQECPVIIKSTPGFGYNYADLPAIYFIIMPLLKGNGLGFTQLLEGEGIVTILFHVESGEELRSTTIIPQNIQLAKMNTYQVMGSAYSYYRRYALSSMLGIITDKDTDAHSEEVEEVQQPVKKQPPKQVQATSDSCPKCGAGMKISQAGKPYCSKLCWKNEESQPNGRPSYPDQPDLQQTVDEAFAPPAPQQRPDPQEINLEDIPFN